MRKVVVLLPLVLALATPALVRAKGGSTKSPPTKTDTPTRATPSKASARARTRSDKPCLSPPVHVVRVRGGEVEHRDLSLTFCDGSVNPAALDSISVLSRPRDVARPLIPEIRAYQRRPVDRGPQAKRRHPNYLSEHVMRVHPGLLVRLQRVAKRFPGRTLEIISGHRPDARNTSRHHHGRALDMRVQGVSREALRDFLRTFDQTGVGYYPNSYFVHMDVRDERGYWVDRSGPGEPPDYGRWPPPKDEVARMSAKVVQGAVSELNALRTEATLEPASAGSTQREARAPANDARPEAVRARHAQRERSYVRSARLQAISERLTQLEAMSARSTRPTTLVEQAPVAQPDMARDTHEDEDEDLNARDVERIREEALRAIQAL